MYNFKKSLTTLAGVLVLLAVAAAVTPFTGHGQGGNNIETTATSDVRVVNTSAAPVMTRVVNPTSAPVPTRDVDRPRAGNIVTLDCTTSLCYRLLPTGVKSASQFVVPAGQALVLTDVEWVTECNGCGYVSGLLQVRIGDTIVYTSFVTLNGNGFGGTSESMKTGVAVAAGKSLRLTTYYSYPKSTLLHGYLTPAT